MCGNVLQAIAPFDNDWDGEFSADDLVSTEKDPRYPFQWSFRKRMVLEC